VLDCVVKATLSFSLFTRPIILGPVEVPEYYELLTNYGEETSVEVWS